MIEMEKEGDTLILTPCRDLRELEFEEIEAELREVLRNLNDNPEARNVIVDFGNTDLFGSTALGLFLRLWKSVRNHNGRMVLCNVSPHEKEILAVTRLGDIWAVYPCREDAVAAMKG
jgi:stage II sporulation protein AA (anti-sigma F factor antagonist)